VPRPRVDGGWRSATRAHVLAVLPPAPEARPRRASLPRLAFALPLIAVALAAIGTYATASAPGDGTFAVRLVFERVELLSATTVESRYEVLWTQADRRLNDLERVATGPSERRGAAADEYVGALARLGAYLDSTTIAEPGERMHLFDDTERMLSRHVGTLEQLQTSSGDVDIGRALVTARRLIEHVHAAREERGGGAPASDPTTTAVPTAGGGGPGRSGGATGASATSSPDRTSTPQPTHTPDPTRTPDATRTPDPTRTPDATRTPDPTRDANEHLGGDNGGTPVPSPTPRTSPSRSPTPTPTTTPTPTGGSSGPGSSGPG